ncbi:MAG: heme lyase CcmF/NrfE family subunit [Acidiferrobacterales bacterium]
MIPEIGHFALILALTLALLQAALPIIGAARGNVQWMQLARPLAFGQTFFLIVSFAALTYAFIINDFSVKYVATNSNSALPLGYRISAVWGGHEGSLLLWALVMGFWSSAVAIFSKKLPQITIAQVLGVMGLISIGFLLFMLLTSNPFDRLIPAAPDGRDLNPLLQDIGLILHPPMLYMGYVGFSVAFSFATAALLSGHLDAAWARWSRPWTTVAWLFLTLGIALGSWWAYYELGWGGWWFWDPVENSSFMPWLVGTALIHSLAVTEKRGTFKSWTVLLALLAFSLSLLGTFLVRSGVLTSVHAFATDPERGIFILVFLAIVIGGSLTLYAWRGPQIRSFGKFQLVSRESLLLVNNVLLVVACAAVLIGTLYPLVLDAMGLGKISVGPPYFSRVFVPIMIPLLFLMGIGPLMRWKKDDPVKLMRHLRLVLLFSFIIAVIFTWLATAELSLGVLFSITLSVWITGSALLNLWKRIKSKNNLATGIKTTPLSFYGMTVAHIGMAVLVVGVTFASAYSIEKDVRMDIGQSRTIGGYTFRFDGIENYTGANFQAKQGKITVTKSGKLIALLKPQKRTYKVQSNPMTEAAISPGFFQDLYVAMGEPLDSGAWSIRIYYKPYVRWIWMGTILMALGGALAVGDRRYRLAVKKRSSLKNNENMEASVS